MSFKCHRCGIQLATKQSLQYHLNKKIKCNSLQCNSCEELFQSTSSLSIHKSECAELSSRTQERYKLYDTLERHDQMILETTIDGMIKYISKSCLNILGYSQDYLIGKNTYSFICKEDIKHIPKFKINFNESKKKEEKYPQYRKVTKNDNNIWLESTVPKYINDNLIVFYETVIISKKLLEQNIMINDIQKNTKNEYIFQCTKKGTITFVNETFKDTVISKSIFEENIKSFFYNNFALQTGTHLCSFKTELIHINVECTLKYFEEYSTFTGVFKKYSLNKDELFRSFVHELRNPINSLCQCSEYASIQIDDLETNILPNLSEKYNKLYNEKYKCIHLNQETNINLVKNLLNDFLDFEKINMNTFKINFDEKCKIRHIIELVKTIINPFLYFEEKTIIYNCSSNCEDIITVDKTRTSQILINLIQNAIKYCEGKEIKVNIFLENSILKMDISHLGTIAENHIKYIFEPFYRINMEKNDGTGLGLYICKQIIEKMFGNIKFSNTNDIINVSVEIPVKNSKIEGDKVNLLIIDDFSGIRSTKLILETYGFNVDITKSGDSALELISKNMCYDVILVDKNMNGLSGIETVKKIRKLNHKVIIYGFTGDTIYNGNNQFKCSINGVNDILYKPLNCKDLIEKYNRDKIILHPLF